MVTEVQAKGVGLGDCRLSLLPSSLVRRAKDERVPIGMRIGSIARCAQVNIVARLALEAVPCQGTLAPPLYGGIERRIPDMGQTPQPSH